MAKFIYFLETDHYSTSSRHFERWQSGHRSVHHHLAVAGHSYTLTYVGCNSGFGHLTALSLNRRGLTVYAARLSPTADGSKSLKEKAFDPKKMHLIAMDVTSDKSVRAAFEHVQKYLSKDRVQLCGLANNAGVLRLGCFERGSFDFMVKSVIDVNVLGTARVTKTFLRLIKKSESRTVNINSTASYTTVPFLITYSMSKRASLSMTDGLRRELKIFNVKVISVEPHSYATQMCGRSFTHSLMDTAWNGSTQEVKSGYGQKFFGASKKRCDDLTSPEPRVLVASLFVRVMEHTLRMLSTELFDFIVNEASETGHLDQVYAES